MNISNSIGVFCFFSYNRDNNRPSFVSYRPSSKSSSRASYRSFNKQSSKASHRNVHKVSPNVPSPYWQFQVHRGVDVTSKKVVDYWKAMGNSRWDAHVPFPYYHYNVAKGVAVSEHELKKILKDFWWDVGNDKWRYGIKQLIGTISGVVGYYMGTSALGVVSGPLFGFVFASAEHYLERRFSLFSKH